MSEPVEKSVLENANQISQFREEQGYPCAYNTIASHIRKGTLVPRRGGGFAPGTVLSWAKKYVQRRAIDVSPEADAPQEQTETGYVAEQSARIKLRIQEQDLEDKRFAAAKERGRYILAETWDAELGERARVFRIGLEKFGTDMALPVAADFGGEMGPALELAASLGFSGEAQKQAAQGIMDFILGRSSFFVRRWMERIDLFLDPYASDRFWTDDMRAAFELYMAHKDEEAEA